MIENSSKAPLHFSLLKCTYLGKNHFNIISAKSEKMKLKSGHLEFRFSVVLHITMVVVLVCKPSVIYVISSDICVAIYHAYYIIPKL